MPDSPSRFPEPKSGHLARVGMAGALFFLIKGVAWLAIPGLALLRGCD